MFSSSDDELDQSSFLNDLQDIGLFDKNVKGVKKQPPKKAKIAPPPKKPGGRPPRQNFNINLDDLLDGIEPESISQDSPPKIKKKSSPPPPPPSQSKSTIKSQHSNISISNNYQAPPLSPPKNFSLDSIQQSINSYLEKSLMVMMHNFLSDFSTILKELDKFEPTIEDFLNSLKDSIRSELNYQKNIQPSNDNDYSSLFVDYDSSFQHALNSIAIAKSKSYSEKLKTIRNARSTLATIAPNLSTQLSESLREITTEVKSLNSERAQAENAISDFLRAQSLNLRKEISLECRGAELLVETDIISKRLSKLNDKRQQLEEQEELFEQDYTDQINSAIQSIKNESQKTFSTSPDILIREARTELNSIRSLYSYQTQVLQNAVIATSPLFAMPRIPTLQPLALNISHQLDRQMLTMQMPESYYPSTTQIPKEIDDISDFSLSKQKEFQEKREKRKKEEALAKDVERNLRILQEQREASLQEVSTYISKIKRSEKSRPYISRLTLDSIS